MHSWLYQQNRSKQTDSFATETQLKIAQLEMPQDIILQLVSTRYWDLLKGMYATDFNKSQVLPENKINERSSEISVKDLYIIPENN